MLVVTKKEIQILIDYYDNSSINLGNRYDRLIADTSDRYDSDLRDIQFDRLLEAMADIGNRIDELKKELKQIENED